MYHTTYAFNTHLEMAMKSGEVWDNVCGIWSGRPGVYTYIHHSGPVYVLCVC